MLRTGRANKLGHDEEECDRKASLLARVSAPSTTLRVVPLPRFAGEDRHVADSARLLNGVRLRWGRLSRPACGELAVGRISEA